MFSSAATSDPSIGLKWRKVFEHVRPQECQRADDVRVATTDEAARKRSGAPLRCLRRVICDNKL